MTKHLASIIIVGFLISFAVAGCMPTPPGPTPTPPGPTPTPSPEMEKDFTLSLVTEGTLTLGDYLGQPIVVNFFLPRCSGCILEVPHLNTVYNRYQESHDLVVVGVGVGSLTAIRQFAEEHGTEYPVGYDRPGTVADLYGVRGVPHTVFFNRQGRIQGQPVVGMMNEAQLENRLQEIL